MSSGQTQTSYYRGRGGVGIFGAQVVRPDVPMFHVPQAVEIVKDWRCPECTATERSALIPTQRDELYLLCNDCVCIYYILEMLKWK